MKVIIIHPALGQEKPLMRLPQQLSRLHLEMVKIEPPGE